MSLLWSCAVNGIQCYKVQTPTESFFNLVATGNGLNSLSVSRLNSSSAGAWNIPAFIRIVEIKKGVNIGAVLQPELFLPTA
jgi:hypothetical protein